MENLKQFINKIPRTFYSVLLAKIFKVTLYKIKLEFLFLKSINYYKELVKNKGKEKLTSTNPCNTLTIITARGFILEAGGISILRNEDIAMAVPKTLK